MMLLLFCFLHFVSAIHFDTLVSFGDSYSSINGGLTDGGPQSYYNSRIAKALNVSNFICYANGGAIMDKRVVPGYKAAPQYHNYANSVAYQMNSFQNNPNDSSIAFNSNTLYVLWIGFNDLNFNRFSIANWTDWTATVSYFIKANIDFMDNIYKANPHYKPHQWLILNLPTFYKAHPPIGAASLEVGRMLGSIMPALCRRQTTELQVGNTMHYVSYGDGIFPIQSHCIGKHEGANLSRELMMESLCMSKMRISNEWAYEVTKNLFPLCKYEYGLKIRKSPLVPYYYTIATLLRNAHVCCYGGLTSSYFNCPPPSLKDYFA